MGILNVTPDSFSDGGQFDQQTNAIEHALQMIDEGADIIDVGGESTRPGADSVNVETELERVIPIILAIRRQSDIQISVDTSKPEVMTAAVKAGANLINDVRALQLEGALQAACDSGADICLMHMLGEPHNMQNGPEYTDVIGDINRFFVNRILACEMNGISKSRLIWEPGFGFGKTLQQNLELLSKLKQFDRLELPILVGMSRKSMFGDLLNTPVAERLPASLAAAVIAMQQSAAIIRVHDVKAHVQARDLFVAVQSA